MSRSRREVGQLGEALAAERLMAEGWRVVETNWRCRLGELDVIARDGTWLVVVEVRTVRRGGYGQPEESVGPAKQQRLIRLGKAYTQSVNWSGPWRIDVVAIVLDDDGGVERMDHYRNAVVPGS